MKSVEDCISWIDNVQYRPGDYEYLKAIRKYLIDYSRHQTLIPVTYKGKPLQYSDHGFLSTYCGYRDDVKDE